MIRRCWIVLKWTILVVLMGLFTVLATLPLWIAPVARAALDRYGVEYDLVTTTSDGLLELRNLAWNGEELSFHAEDLRVALPPVWLTGLLLQRPFRFLEGDRLTLVLKETGRDPERERDAFDLDPVHRQAHALVQRFGRWLPRADFTRITVEVSETFHLHFQSLVWDRPQLGFEGQVRPFDTRPVDVLGQVHRTETGFEMEIRSPWQRIHLVARTEQRLTALDVTARGRMLGNRLESVASFGRSGYLPRWAQWTIRLSEVPEAAGFWLNQAASVTLEGRLEEDGDLHRFWNEADLHPHRGQVRLEGGWNGDELEVATLDWNLGWSEARLKETARLPLSGSGPASVDLEIRIEPEVFPSFGDGGTITGALHITSLHGAAPPTGSLQLEAREVQFSGNRAETFSLLLDTEPEGITLRADLGGLRPAGGEDLPFDWEDGKAQLEARITPEGLSAATLSAHLAGATLEGRGRWPVDTKTWEDLAREVTRPQAWRQASGSLKLHLPDFENLRELMPPLIRPTGQLEARLDLNPGGEWNGFLEVKGLATFPIPPFGTFREGEATLRFHERGLEVEHLSVNWGGRPLTMTGTLIHKRGLQFRPQLSLKGEGIPLVRQPGVIIRTDLDLTLGENPQGRTLLSGRLDLGSSFVFLELPSLQPSPAEASRRPPYFSIPFDPFADWVLDLAVSGDRFLELRNPLFRTRLSADLRLIGTLEEPMAIGEATLHGGYVLFPFARYRIEQGRIELTRGNPFAPEIFLAAQSRLFGYDLFMDLTGPTTDPYLELSSAPPLDSGSILQMVSTGRRPDDHLERGARLEALGIYFGRGWIDRLRVEERDMDQPSFFEELEILIGADISDAGQNTVEVRLPLSERWSLLGDYDRFDSYNLNLQYKLFER